MLNKKLLLTAIAAASIVSSNATAETRGNYIGLNLINTHTRSGVNYLDVATRGHKNHSSFGVDYKYAFNFNKFFVAPGVFYDYNDANADFAIPNGSRFSNNINNSYGIKADFGYDLTEKFSPFVTLGYSITRQIVSAYGGGLSLEDNKSSSSNEGLVYGAGLRYSLTNAVSVTAAYEITQFGLNSNLDGLIGGTDKLNSDYKVAKLGVAYNF